METVTPVQAGPVVAAKPSTEGPVEQDVHLGQEKSTSSQAQSCKSKQVGHDTDGRRAESEVLALIKGPAARRGILVSKQPKGHYLKSIYSAKRGIVFDLIAQDIASGRELFIEVKNQGVRGNAHERAYKHYTPLFQKKLREKTGLDYHPVATVMCGNLATDKHYQDQFEVMLEPEHCCLATSPEAVLEFFTVWFDKLQSDSSD